MTTTTELTVGTGALIGLSPELWGEATELTDLPAIEKAAKLVISEHYPSAAFWDVRQRDGSRVGFRVELDDEEWDAEWWSEVGWLEALDRAELPEPISVTPIDLDDLTALDLREELLRDLPSAFAFRIDFVKNGAFGNQPHAEALFVPGRGRVGISYGGDAQWADILPEDTGEECPQATIALWHADNDAYAARN